MYKQYIEEHKDFPIEGINYLDFNELGDNWVKYEGYFKDGLRHGEGKLILTNAATFTGQWNEGLIHGTGRY